MDYKYIQGLQNVKEFAKGWPLIGLSEIEIKDLELKFNNGRKFPKSFEEFLLIAGKQCYSLESIDTDFEELREEIEEYIEDYDTPLERPYLCFDNYAGQFLIFFLDEELEDPKCYNFSPSLFKSGKYDLIRPIPQITFSKLINEAVSRRLIDLRYGK